MICENEIQESDLQSENILEVMEMVQVVGNQVFKFVHLEMTMKSYECDITTRIVFISNFNLLLQRETNSTSLMN